MDIKNPHSCYVNKVVAPQRYTIFSQQQTFSAVNCEYSQIDDPFS